MFFTRVLNAVKSKYVLVEVESTATGFKREMGRLRRSEKLEYIDFDPLIRRNVVFKETKKLKGLEQFHKEEWKDEDRKVTPAWAVRLHKGRITSSD